MTHQDIKVITKPLKHRFSSRRLFGEAWDNGEIWINLSQSESDRLNTVIHECLHVFYPKWSEARVKRVADRLSEVLWRDGWRRLDPRRKGVRSLRKFDKPPKRRDTR